MENLIQSIQFTNIWWAIITPLILMVVDIVTGYYNAWKNNEVSSSKMRDGLGKKLAELTGVFLGILAKYSIGADPIMYFAIIYVCFMEGLSIIENWEKLGFKMPQKLREKLNNKGEQTEKENSIS